MRTVGGLTSSVLKAMEKLIGKYMSDTILFGYQNHKAQHDYHQGKSTETTLHTLACHIVCCESYRVRARRVGSIRQNKPGLSMSRVGEELRFFIRFRVGGVLSLWQHYKFYRRNRSSSHKCFGGFLMKLKEGVFYS